ncbi:unnamed protein product [Durusdinium trenchii]|uniref:Uncharacterized protein n=2 Tax=Durusdinium trenchii TaxID=1381693 RepID=A0ABP0LDM4_9DINO
MKAVLGVSLAVLAAGDQVAQASQPAQPAVPDVTMGQLGLSNQMGAYYRSMYAPVPAMQPGAAGVAPQPAASGVGAMGGMGFGGAYAPMGTQVGQVQASQAQLANQLGGMYRSQYVTPDVEAQIRAQQAAQAAQQAAQAQQAEKEAKGSKGAKGAKGAEVLLAAAPATEAPTPMDAKDCTTMDQLDAWLKARSDSLKKYVPKDYQSYAMKSVESEYNSNKERIEDAKKGGSGSKPVTGPLLLAENEGKDPESMIDQFKKEVADKTKDVEGTANSWVDEVSQAVKGAFDKAADAVEGSADKTADKVKQKVEDIKEKQKHEKHDKKEDDPEVLLAQEKGTSPVLFLVPCLALGAAAGVYLRRRASDDELVSVYHMQV